MYTKSVSRLDYHTHIVLYKYPIPDLVTLLLRPFVPIQPPEHEWDQPLMLGVEASGLSAVNLCKSLDFFQPNLNFVYFHAATGLSFLVPLKVNFFPATAYNGFV